MASFPYPRKSFIWSTWYDEQIDDWLFMGNEELFLGFSDAVTALEKRLGVYKEPRRFLEMGKDALSVLTHGSHG